MVAGGLLNAYLTVTAPQMWGALGAWFGAPAALRAIWDATMTAHPRVWPPLVGVAYELAVGVLALSPRRALRLAGLAGIVLFHLGLLAMGLWWWALPVLALVIPATIVVAHHRDR